ncbi:hypothetical protein, partial [Pseudomonas fluorescens]|uniref:hypothetical protein n=1 Tax=Pseudomonas fluorescens TaxID=294 RepID=UPI0018AFBCA1
GGQAGKSDPVKLSVLKITDEDPRLPTPNIEGKTSQELEVYSLPEDAKIHVDTWAFQRAGQLVYLTLEGTDRNNTSVRKVLLDGDESPPAEGLTLPAPIDWLITLKDESKVWILFSVIVIDTATKINFPRRNYTAYVLNPSGIEKWENEPINTTFPLNIPITVKSGLTVTSLSSAGNCYIADMGYLLIAKHCSFRWKDQGKRKVTVLLSSFWITTGNTITSHDIAGNIIQSFNTSDYHITFTGTPNRLIHSITIKAIQEPDIGGYCREIAWE